ncbi:MAG: hypothetical protein V1724_05300, partial [Chloroflexota bacterium]
IFIFRFVFWTTVTGAWLMGKQGRVTAMTHKKGLLLVLGLLALVATVSASLFAATISHSASLQELPS